MQVVEQKLNIGRSASFPESSFKIKASAKAFAILSSGLYSNKVRAIVRELGTNAADAHITAGNSNPFTVHLPNSFEPFFSIRDYGTGLSPEDIEHIYTTYFESTKTNSNDLTGCLGLGSKSPFSYTDNFTVTDFWNGKKHTYTSFIGESGFPTIALLSTEETTEPNGLEVKFAVQTNDFGKFGEEAKYVYSFFKTKPKIVGQNVTLNEWKPSFSGNDWSVFNTGGNNRVIMGNVAYPLDMYQAGCNNNIFTYYSIHIDVAIGEVEMTASREALEYTAKTKVAIQKRIKECLEVFSDNLQKELNEKATYWEACQFYEANSLFLKNPTWKGNKVTNRIYLDPEIPADKFENYSSKVWHRKHRTLNKLEPSHDNNLLLVENDLPRGAIDRVRHYLKGTKYNNAYLIKFTEASEKQKLFDTVCGQFPDGMYVLASSLPKPVRVAGQRSGPAPQGFEFISGQEKVTHSWNPQEVDLTEGGVYVELEGWSPKDFSVGHLNYIYNSLTGLGKSVKIYGIRSKLGKKVVDNTEWQSLKEYVEEVVAELKDDYLFAENYSSYVELSNLTRVRQYIKQGELDSLFKKIEYCVKNKNRLASLKRLMDWVGIKGEKVNVEDEVNQVKKKYPLVFFILQNCHSLILLNGSDIGTYVKLVDDAEKALTANQ